MENTESMLQGKSRSVSTLVEWSLRVSLAAAFLSAVADRFGLTGPAGAPNVGWGSWQPFVDYTGTLLFFLPKGLVSVAAVLATAAEVILALWLLTGWQTRLAAYGSALLLLSFALAMTLALGVKAPLNYSVFTAAAAAFALGAMKS
ncbi:DoxX-like protein [Roseimicrobium gellanilyticum]|uniref:DoxX-like protein n=1 Tax=Roseimicrobium gellanilyticum TaxID=748857 RepID=A0A366HT52_9BACT|nr:DoxX family membrane protein [Roseimicrobium gellanilyticum]RBP46103.1 DoxX-like protein [Roseimicrobium gellanilyticum]